MNSAALPRLETKALFLLMLLLPASRCVPAVAANRPNVVILLADDLGSKDLGCYGGPVKTPALDRLAAKGVRFTDFHSGAPVCSTARASLLTGRHHLRTGVYTVIQDHIHKMHLRQSEVTIAEVLKANGYDTVQLGKWHLGTPFRESYVAFDKDNNRPLCNLYVNMLNHMGIETKAFATSTGELSW